LVNLLDCHWMAYRLARAEVVKRREANQPVD
jgi:hypothetical protein